MSDVENVAHGPYVKLARLLDQKNIEYSFGMAQPGTYLQVETPFDRSLIRVWSPEAVGDTCDDWTMEHSADSEHGTEIVYVATGRNLAILVRVIKALLFVYQHTLSS